MSQAAAAEHILLVQRRQDSIASQDFPPHTRRSPELLSLMFLGKYSYVTTLGLSGWWQWERWKYKQRWKK